MDARSLYTMETGSRRTVEEVHVEEENCPSEIDYYQCGGCIEMVHPDYLEWLEDKAAKIFELKQLIESKL